MDSLNIRNLNNQPITGENILMALPKKEINRNWLISDFSGDNRRSREIAQLDAFGDEFIWLTGEQLLAEIDQLYFYEGVCTGFSPETKLADVLAFKHQPVWEGYYRDVDLAYIQHPLGEIEIIVDDSSFYQVVSDSQELLGYLHDLAIEAKYETIVNQRISRRFGSLEYREKLPTGMGNWWLEFNEVPIRFEVREGTQLFEERWLEKYPEWAGELVSRQVILPNLAEINGPGILTLKNDLPTKGISRVDMSRGEVASSKQYRLDQSTKNLNYGIAIYDWDMMGKGKKEGKTASRYDQLVIDHSGLAYQLTDIQAANELKFVIAWGYLAENPKSFVLDFACEFELEELLYGFCQTEADDTFTTYQED